jgi:hypothetical protein
MIGGGGPRRLLPLAGRVADIWDLYHGGLLETIDLAAYTEKRDIVRQHATEAGRDPTAIVQSFTIENDALPLPQSREDAATWIAHLRPLVDLGVRQFLLGFGSVTDYDGVRRFAEEVIAPLREQA